MQENLISPFQKISSSRASPKSLKQALWYALGITIQFWMVSTHSLFPFGFPTISLAPSLSQRQTIEAVFNTTLDAHVYLPNPHTSISNIPNSLWLGSHKEKLNRCFMGICSCIRNHAVSRDMGPPKFPVILKVICANNLENYYIPGE